MLADRRITVKSSALISLGASAIALKHPAIFLLGRNRKKEDRRARDNVANPAAD
jgi:hypothetical protein